MREYADIQEFTLEFIKRNFVDLEDNETEATIKRKIENDEKLVKYEADYLAESLGEEARNKMGEMNLTKVNLSLISELSIYVDVWSFYCETAKVGR